MNIKLRFPASAGMTVLMDRVAGVILPTGDPYPVRAKIAKENQYKMQGDAARRGRMSAALPPAQKTGSPEEQKSGPFMCCKTGQFYSLLTRANLPVVKARPL